MRAGSRGELARLCGLLASGVRPVVPEVANSVGMRLALVPPGAFRMGSPGGEEGRGQDEAPHEVRITRPFYLGVFPVTQAEYKAVTRQARSYFRRGGEGADSLGAIVDTTRFPVESVSWEEAVAFCARLTERERKEGKIGAGQEYRLPSEAEWEYSCRGGAASYQTFHVGDSLSSRQANFHGDYPYGGAEKGAYLGRPSEVGSYAPNGFGLYDLHGNVWEWCADWYDEDAYRTGPFPRIDPRGPPQGSSRVDRGGGWDDLGQRCRSAYRGSNEPAFRSSALGFRVSLVSSGG